MLPRPATIRWSSSSSFHRRGAPGELLPSARRRSISPQRLGPSASKAGHSISSSVGTRSTEPKRRGSFEAEPPALVGLEQQMIVLAKVVRVDPPGARHAEVKDHRVAAVGVDQAIFGAAPRPVTRAPGQPLAKVLGKARRKSRAAPRPADAPAVEACAGRGRWFRLREVRASGVIARSVATKQSSPCWIARCARNDAKRPLEARIMDKVNFGDELGHPRGKDAPRRRGLLVGRPPLRRDERPDVGRHAPAVEGPLRRQGEAAAGERSSTWPAAPATSPSAWPPRARPVTVSDINPDMLASAWSAPRSAKSKASPGRSRMPRR